MTNDPYAQLAPVPEIAVRADFSNGDTLPLTHVSAGLGGAERSPALSWDAVDGAAAYVVSCYDPDAPTMSGYWHWVVKNIPADVTSLAEDAGNASGDLLPAGATAANNEARTHEYLGAYPPPGHGPHRYFFTVSALDAPLDVPEDLTAASVHFMMRESVIARGHVWAVWENKA